MLARKSVVVFLGKLLAGAANAGMTVVLARWLGVDAFGLIGAMLSYKAIAYAFAEFGFSNANLKRLSEESAEVGDCISTYAVIRLATSVGILGVGGGWTAYHHYGLDSGPDTVLLYAVFTGIAALDNFTDVYISTFDAHQDVEKTQVVRVGAEVLGSLATIGLVFVRPTVMAAAAGYACQFVLKFVLGRWFFRVYPGGSVRWEVFLRYWRFALPNALASIVGFVYLHVDRLLLKWLASAEAVGYLYGAQKYVQLLLMVSAATLSLVMTQASKYHSRDDLDGLRRLTKRSQKYLSLLIAPLIAMTGVFAAPLVQLLLGADYMASVPILQVLCIQVFGMTISRPLGMVLYGIDRPGLGSTLSVLGLGVGVGLTFLLVPADLAGISLVGLGAMGVAVSLAVRSVLSWILLSVALERIANVEFYLKPLAHLGVAVLIAAAIRYILPNWTPLLLLAAGGSLVVGVYVGLLGLVGEIAKAEWRLVKDLVRSLRS